MAIKTEYYMTRKDGVVLNKTYSDAGRYVVRDGVSYDSAIDPESLNRQYTEGDLIPKEDSEEPNELNEEIIEKAAAYDVLTGVAE